MTFRVASGIPKAMKSDNKPSLSHELAQRKGDHIELASRSRTDALSVDARFYYEPMFFSHVTSEEKWETRFLSFILDYPIWISSMTGGTEHAGRINENLARLCGEFNLGMGLGSCRALLKDDSTLKDFAVKKFMPDQPLLGNIGIAQLEELVLAGKDDAIHELVKKLEADGMIIHINPLQEWFQPEGDRFKFPPIETLKRFVGKGLPYKVIIKEVGHGIGPHSLNAILSLPVDGVEFAAYGGTNFSLLESLRGNSDETREEFIHVGHTPEEMVEFLNRQPRTHKDIIISGGIKSPLDAFYLKSKLKNRSMIGMASAFLEPALKDYDTLKNYFLKYKESLLTARKLLALKEDN